MIQGSYDIHSFRHTANDCSKQFREQRGVFLAMLVRATVMAWKEGRGTFITGTIVEKILSLVFYGAEIQVKKKKKEKEKEKERENSRQAEKKRREMASPERAFLYLPVQRSGGASKSWLVLIREGGGGVRDI